MATVSLPGRVVMHPLSVLQVFIVEELPVILGQFPIKIIALYAQGHSAIRLMEIEQSIKTCYVNVKLNLLNETLYSFMADLQERLRLSKT